MSEEQSIWQRKGLQLFIAGEGLVLVAVGLVTGSVSAALVGVALAAWGFYGLAGRGELATFISGDRDERQSMAFESAYRFGFTAATLWVAGVSVAFWGSGGIPVGWVAAANMAGLVGLVVGYGWELRRS